MQAINPRYQFHLYRHQVVICLLLLVMAVPAQAQNDVSENLLDYDEQWIHYGFLIGLHNSRYRIQYSDAYTSPALDSLHSIVPGELPGWKVGFISDMTLWKYLSFRALLTVAFYEHDLLYRYTDGTNRRELLDATLVELPLMLKYKSARRGNVAMYVTGGFAPAFEAAGGSTRLDEDEKLELRRWNTAIEGGIGFDLYFPLFKFSPEVRYSWGLRNMLTPEVNTFDVALQRLTYQNISFNVTFEGGPTYLKNARKRGRR